MSPDPALVALASRIATAEGCDPVLIAAMIEQESNWNPWAIRYEPKFLSKYVGPLYTAHKITATEAFSRSFSWSLLQTMGQTMREIGYSGPLPQLCDPNVGLPWGCKLWLKKLASADGDVTKGLLLWNGGGAPTYATEVLARMARYAPPPATR